MGIDSVDRKALKLYDEAMVEKIKKVFSNTYYAPPDKLFLYSGEDNDGLLKLPIIGIHRPGGFSINRNLVNYSEYMRGKRVKVADDQTLYRYMRSLPVTIPYRIEVWGEEDNTVTQILKELIFFFHYEPTLIISIPELKNDEAEEPSTEKARGVDGLAGYSPEQDYKFEDFVFDIFFESDDINDDSDVMDFEDYGRLYRYTFDLVVPDARLFTFADMYTVLDVDVTYKLVEPRNLGFVDEGEGDV